MKVEKTIARYEEALVEAVKGFKSMLAALAKAVSQEKAGRAVKQQKKVTDGQQKLKTFVKDLSAIHKARCEGPPLDGFLRDHLRAFPEDWPRALQARRRQHGRGRAVLREGSILSVLDGMEVVMYNDTHMFTCKHIVNL